MTVQFLLRRISGALLSLILVSLAAFILLDLAPGDAAQAALGESASQAQLAQARKEMGLDQPLLIRFEQFARDVVFHGDLGTSITYNRPVSTLLAERFGYTLQLALSAILLAVLAGVPVGWAAAAYPGSWLDLGLMSVCSVGIATPGFWLAMLLVMVFSVRFGWFPPVGAGDLRHLIMPALCLALPSAAAIARLSRASMLDTRRAAFIRTAYAKGLAGKQVWQRHILRNSLIPIVTLIGLQLSHLLGGAFIVENIFAWPGLGRLVVQAIFDRDFPVVLGAVLLIAAINLGMNLSVDAAQALIDPRTNLDQGYEQG